jgi:DNA invertase Pin-like site-specific DNA recombinase
MVRTTGGRHRDLTPQAAMSGNARVPLRCIGRCAGVEPPIRRRLSYTTISRSQRPRSRRSVGRPSDTPPGLDAQMRDLKAAGCEEIFSEQVSAVAQRDCLKEALRFVRRGDTLVACKPDRLARSTTDLLRIVDELDRRWPDHALDGWPTDRHPQSHGQADGDNAGRRRGIRAWATVGAATRRCGAKAKADGKYKGRKPTARAKAADVIRLNAEGLQRTEIAERLGIGVASVYRVLADAEKGADFSKAA